MNKRFNEPRKLLLVTALLVATLTLPTAGIAQTPATTGSSLDDTLNWLKTFLPSATGADSTYGANGSTPLYSATQTSRLDMINGCQVKEVTRTTLYEGTGLQRKKTVDDTFSYVFSLADVDPNSIAIGNCYGAIDIEFKIRNNAATVDVTSDNYHRKNSAGSVVGFADHTSAERVQKALRHAAELCAQQQPF